VIECEKYHPSLKLKYGFNHRCHDSIVEAIKMIRDGSLGKILNMRGVYGKSSIINFTSEWRTERKFAGGGILLDRGIHMVDLMRLFSGEFSEVLSFISNKRWGSRMLKIMHMLLCATKMVLLPCFILQRHSGSTVLD
jgi:predicted dehydrogenase|tara:strand:+ start:47 stop:457 length:411 start_codon:yes stop_codon:yes gene_type:complete